MRPEIISSSFLRICLTWKSIPTRSVSTRCCLGESSFRKTLHDKMRHPILSRMPLVFLGTCFRWEVTYNIKPHFTLVSTSSVKCGFFIRNSEFSAQHMALHTLYMRCSHILYLLVAALSTWQDRLRVFSLFLYVLPI